MIFIQIVRPFIRWWYRKYPPEMVKWWKKQSKVRAKRIRMPEGDYRMLLEGEKYLQPNYPRGHILFGKMSKLKHVIKNEIFNRSWYALEMGYTPAVIATTIKHPILDDIFTLMEDSRYDMLPFKSLSPCIKELYRGFTVVASQLSGERAARCLKLRDLIIFILQEDDAYRFRFQWVAGLFHKTRWIRRITGRGWEKDFDFALALLEQGEVIGDMKERQRLFRRVIMMALKDPDTRQSFDCLVASLDWKKLSLSKADKYYFRGKYFKVDYPLYDY